MTIYRTKFIFFVLCLMLLIPSLTGAAALPSPEDSTANLRSSLGKILGEHSLLAILTMQKGYDNAVDLDPAKAAWIQNSDELAAIMASVYGEDAGIAFKAIWNAHIGFYLDYVKADLAKDNAAQNQADTSLDAYSRQLADFIADANPNLQESAMEEALLQHKTLIINSFKAYAAKDHIAAYQHARNAYKIMFMTADGITAAISAQFPNKYPKANAMTK
jgi:hypothetical protein